MGNAQRREYGGPYLRQCNGLAAQWQTLAAAYSYHIATIATGTAGHGSWALQPSSSAAAEATNRAKLQCWMSRIKPASPTDQAVRVGGPDERCDCWRTATRCHRPVNRYNLAGELSSPA